MRGLKKRIAILGSTGSIGTQTLDIVAAHREEFEVVALCAHSNIQLLKKQIAQFAPAFVGVTDRERAAELERDLPKGAELAGGPDALLLACEREDVDLVALGVVGISGLSALMRGDCLRQKDCPCQQGGAGLRRQPGQGRAA